MNFFDFGGNKPKSSNKVRSTNSNKKNRVSRNHVSSHNVTAKQLHPAKLHSAKSHSKQVIGKVYADWCGHCKTLIPEWKIMKANIQNKFPDKYIFSEIEDKHSANGVEKINKMFVIGTNPKLTVNGFPTVYKILNGRVEYYSGARQAPDMEKWFLNGGTVGTVGGKRSNRKQSRKQRRKQSNK